MIGGSIYLRAIAGRDNDEFGERSLQMTTEYTRKRSTDLFLIKCKPFAQMDRCRSVIEADRNDMHLQLLCSRICNNITIKVAVHHLGFFRFRLTSNKTALRVRLVIRRMS